MKIPAFVGFAGTLSPNVFTFGVFFYLNNYFSYTI